MILPVADDVVVNPHQRAEDAQVALKTGGKRHHLLLAEKGRQLCLQLQMHLQGSVEETGAGAAGSVLLQGVNAGLNHLGIGGQTQIIVGAQHDPALSLHLNHRVLPGLQRMKVRINSKFPGFVCPGTHLTFFKYVHRYLL